MKKLLLICCFMISIVTVAQQINEPFQFPIKPGTKEWSGLKTEKERFSAMQIPDDILKRMSTPALVCSCINFPAFGFIGAYNNYQTGFVILATKFNGLKELANRADAEKSLVNVYKTLELDASKNKELGLDENYWPIRFSWVELMLAQKKLIGSLNTKERNELLRTAQKRLIEKQSIKEYSYDGMLTTLFLIGRVLHTLEQPEFEKAYIQNEYLKKFIDTSELSDPSISDLIIELSSNYMNKIRN